MAEQQSFSEPEEPIDLPKKTKTRRWPGRTALFLAGMLTTGVPAGVYIWQDLLGKPVAGAAAGEIVCPNGEAVVGAWIEPNDHADRGWATLATEPGQVNRATFTASIPHSSAYSIHVGCGGTPENWQHDNPSPSIAIGPILMQVTCVDHLGIKNGTCAIENLMQPASAPTT